MAAGKVPGPQPRRPPRAVAWWEALAPWQQLLIALPPLSAFLLWLNLDLFNQPLARSVGYGIFEGGLATALLLVATANERSRRQP